MLNNFLTIPIVEVKLALAIPTDASTALVNEMIDTPPVVALETINTLSMQSKAATYLLNFLLHDVL